MYSSVYPEVYMALESGVSVVCRVSFVGDFWFSELCLVVSCRVVGYTITLTLFLFTLPGDVM